MEQNSQKIRPTLLSLGVEQSVIFGIRKLKSVRTQASELGAMYGIKFKTKTDRDAHTITVTRVL